MVIILKKYDYFIYPLLILIIGLIIGIYIKDDVSFYSELTRPNLAPPKFVFPLVWSVLYILIGIVYSNIKNQNYFKKIKFLFYFSLILNFLWPIIFFKEKLIFLALLDIILLALVILSLLILFIRKKSKVNSIIFSLYLVWIFFASYLNIAVYILN